MHTYTKLQICNANIGTRTLVKNTLHLRGTKQLKEKPTVVADYNQYMLGIDRIDQLVSSYSFLHKSMKWWKVFF